MSGKGTGLRATKCWGRSPELRVGDQVAKEGNSVRSATLVIPTCVCFANGQGHAQKEGAAYWGYIQPPLS